MRLIHIVENLDKGAVENWLVNVFLESRKLRPQWEWTFYCILGKEGRLDEKVRAAGGKIIFTPVSISRKISFLYHLRATLVAGKYDIIHAHHDYLSGFYMLSSLVLSGRKLIHVHNNDEEIPVGNERLRKILLPIFRKFAFWVADDIIAISENTKEEFRKNYSGRKPRFQLLYYGIHMDKFEANTNPIAFRHANNLPADSRILLYTGRINRDKNPIFLIDILQNLLTIRKDVFAVFVGKGDLEKVLLSRAKEKGIDDHIRMIGWSDDIPGIMKSSDVLVFPRLEFPKEGLGLVVVESQCAGLPVFTTHGIVQDAIILKETVFFLDLTDPDKWAKSINKFLENGAELERHEALKTMKNSKFEIVQATFNLIKVYEN